MSTPASSGPYHQTHRPTDLLACPFCHRDTCVVRSYPDPKKPGQRCYYVECEAEQSDECHGTFEGPSRSSVREAARAYNEALLHFVRDVEQQNGDRPLPRPGTRTTPGAPASAEPPPRS